MPGGLWRGTLMDCAAGEPQDFVTAMVSEDGRFRILAYSEQLLAGVLGTTGDLFDGTGTDFAPVGIQYFSGPTTDLFVQGRIDERQKLVGRWGTEWGNYGTFSFEYVGDNYERPTPLADLAGAWPLATNYLGQSHMGIWTVEPNGRFDGQDDIGCLYSGQFSLVDERYSILAVELGVTGCDLAGSYNGLALYEDLIDWWEKGMTVSVDDGTRALRIGLAIEAS
jgi:hypothetical protein